MCQALGIVRMGWQTASSDARARFEREVIAQLDALYTFALRLTRERADAEDLVSATIVRAFDRWEQYTLGTNIRAWLCTILYHNFVNRRRVERRELALGDDEDGHAPFEAVGVADPEGNFYDSFIDEDVARAIDELPAPYRVAIVLSDIQGLRYAEIAVVLDVPEGTVKSRLFRARRMLQKKLFRYAVEMGYVKSGHQAISASA